MTDINLLQLLDAYYISQRNVLFCIKWSMECFEEGSEDASWLWLFKWCEDKDRREALWKQFKHDYPRAMMLKEGFCDD